MLTKFFIKKHINNRRQLLTTITCLTLAVSLIAGISIFVDQESESILFSYLNDEEKRIIDYYMNIGENNPIETLAEIDANLTNSWIKSKEGVYVWSFVAINDYWNSSIGEIENFHFNQGLTGIISCNNSFYDSYPSLLNLIEGNFDISAETIENETIYNVVVLETFLEKSVVNDLNLTLGSQFTIFSWGKSSGNIDYITATDLKTCRISGIVSSNSSLLKYDEFHMVEYTSGIIGNFDIRPSFYDVLVYQESDTGLSKVFDSVLLVQADDNSINKDNPNSLIKTLTLFEQAIKDYFNPYLEGVTVDSPLKETLSDYSYWLYLAKPNFIMFSSPLLFLGYYLLQFSFNHTMDERKKEISGIKSRGFSNVQVLWMLSFENIFDAIISSILGVGVGVIFSGALYGIQNDKLANFADLEKNINIVFPYLNFQTFSLTLVAALVFIFATSLIPIIKLIRYPIDEMVRSDDTTTEADVDNTVYFGQITILGIFLTLGVPTVSLLMRYSDFYLYLGIVSLGFILTGSFMFMALITTKIPRIIENWIPFTLSSLFILSRESSRKSKKLTGAFIVLSLTIAFGVISSTTISSTTYNYQVDAEFTLGSDIRFDIKYYGQQKDNTIINQNTFTNKELYPEVKNSTWIYEDYGYFLSNEIQFPDYIYDFQSYRRGKYVSNILFIDSPTFKETALIREDYFKSYNRKYTNLSISEDIFLQLETEFNDTAIIDSKTADLYDIQLGDQVNFTLGSGGYYDIYRGKKNIIGIIDRWPGYYIASDTPFIITDQRSIADEFNVEYPMSYIILKLTDDYKTIDEWDSIFLDKVEKDVVNTIYLENGAGTLNMLSDTSRGREFTSLISLLTLDLYYAILIAAIGFFIIIEIRVQERKKEIGVLKALGFSNYNTFSLVFTEGIMVVTVAIFTGFFVGLIAGQFVNYVFIGDLKVPKIILFDQGLIEMQMLICILTGTIGSTIAALLTRQFKISELLRQE